MKTSSMINRLSLLSLTLVSVCATDIEAQITITRADFEPSSGAIIDTSFTALNPAGIEVILNATGGDQTYDFSVFAYDEGTVSRLARTSSLSAIPGGDDPDFSTANWVQTASEGLITSYSLFTLNDAGYAWNGGVLVLDFDGDGTVENTVFANSPPNLILRFPLAMGAAWTNNFSQRDGTDNVETAEVDGWGTLITPAGREACLRVHKTRLITSGEFSETFEHYLFVTQGRTGATITSSFVGYTVSDKVEVGDAVSTAYEELSWGTVKGLAK